ncbi:MAG: 4Fe-4S dicluster domain-containing protein [Bacteroidales bacterium]|nr:4Fe-4S dicluster domain-containing protein [Bacteroidales bacterium]
MKDVRFEEGLKACMNCGVCSAICPAAEFYDYDPRRVVDLVQSRDNEAIADLLRSETIWYCGQCMSCKTRCPRGNTPGSIISALRQLSQELGLFTISEKGRQQFAVKRTVGDNILKYGYCVAAYAVHPDLHPEQGPVWEHAFENLGAFFARAGGELNGSEGPMRKISPEALDELDRIFRVTCGRRLFDAIELASEKKAHEMGLEFRDTGIDFEYFRYVYTTDSGCHTHECEHEELSHEGGR